MKLKMKDMRTAAVVCILLAALSLSACGSEKAAPAPAMQAVYDEMAEKGLLPDMVCVPAEKGEYYFGIAASDCAQEVTAICQSSMLADEVWLIEAKDAAKAEAIEALAKARLSQKGEEMKNYAPDQYQIVQDAELFREENCVVMLVSPQADQLEEIYRAAQKR